MKRLLLGIIVVVALLFGGCEETFTPQQMQALAAQNEVLQVQLDKVQVVATEIAAEIQAAEIVDAEALAKLAKLNEEIDRVQALMDGIARALKNVALTGDTAQDFIAQLQAANTASGGVNPYVVPIGAGLSALSLFLGWLAKRENTGKVKVQKKYQADKQGRELTLREVATLGKESTPEMLKELMYKNIAKARADLGV